MKPVRKKIHYILMACAIITYLLSEYSLSSQAADRSYPGYKEELDLIFIVDVSGSMKSRDPGYTAVQMIKGFIDLIDAENIRVGYVAYNDVIQSSAAPQAICLQEQQESLKQMIDGAVYQGETDIGLALMHAVSLAEPQENRKTVMILLSDGETDLRKSRTGRTTEDSSQDVEAGIAYCRDNAIPVHAIAFGSSYDGSTELLESIASRTGGTISQTGRPDSLIRIFYEAIQKEAGITILPVTESVYSAGIQNIRYTLPGSCYQYLACLLISSEELKQVEITCNGEPMEITAAGYFLGGRMKPTGEEEVLDIEITAVTREGQDLNVYLIGGRNLESRLTAPSEVQLGETYAFDINLVNQESGEVIQDASLYRNFTVEYGLYRILDNTKVPVKDAEISYEETGIHVSFRLEEKGDYVLKVRLLDFMESYWLEDIPFQAVNEGPTGEFPEQLRFPSTNRGESYDLTQYYQSSSGALTFQLSKAEGKSVVPVLEDGKLSWTVNGIGETTLYFTAEDPYGEVLHTAVVVEIQPLWIYYPGVFTGIAVILLLTCIYLYTKIPRKREVLLKQENHYQFSGKLNAYFTKLPGGMEITPLTFAIYHLKEDKVKLEAFFYEYPEIVEMFGMSEIHMAAGRDKNLIIRNKSKSTVMVGNTIVGSNYAYHVSYGSAIYIMAGDECELELHYVSVIK